MNIITELQTYYIKSILKIPLKTLEQNSVYQIRLATYFKGDYFLPFLRM